MGSIIGLYWRKSEKFLFCFRLFKRQNQSKYGKIGSVSPLSQRWDMFVFVYLLPRRGRGIGEGGLMIFCSGWILYLFSDRQRSLIIAAVAFLSFHQGNVADFLDYDSRANIVAAAGKDLLMLIRWCSFLRAIGVFRKTEEIDGRFYFILKFIKLHPEDSHKSTKTSINYRLCEVCFLKYSFAMFLQLKWAEKLAWKFKFCF